MFRISPVLERRWKIRENCVFWQPAYINAALRERTAFSFKMRRMFVSLSSIIWCRRNRVCICCRAQAWISRHTRHCPIPLVMWFISCLLPVCWRRKELNYIFRQQNESLRNIPMSCSISVVDVMIPSIWKLSKRQKVAVMFNTTGNRMICFLIFKWRTVLYTLRIIRKGWAMCF